MHSQAEPGNEKAGRSYDQARKQPFERDKQPYQNVYLLIRLRNELIHYTPKTLGGSDKHELEIQLKGKFPTNRLMEGSGNPFFPDHCLGGGCAEWALNSSKRFVDEFFLKIGVTPNYQRVDFDKLKAGG
jgi:hypothetical protein